MPPQDIVVPQDKTKKDLFNDRKAFQELLEWQRQLGLALEQRPDWRKQLEWKWLHLKKQNKTGIIPLHARHLPYNIFK